MVTGPRWKVFTSFGPSVNGTAVTLPSLSSWNFVMLIDDALLLVSLYEYCTSAPPSGTTQFCASAENEPPHTSVPATVGPVIPSSSQSLTNPVRPLLLPSFFPQSSALFMSTSEHEMWNDDTVVEVAGKVPISPATHPALCANSCHCKFRLAPRPLTLTMSPGLIPHAPIVAGPPFTEI